MSYSNPADRAWEKLSQVAVHGAVYDSRERLPHPKCLKDTRTNLLKHVYGFLDNPEMSQLVWLHGTAGVGKSAVAFTVAERMRGLKASEVTNVEKRLAGTFFFSRTNTNRRTTGYFFPTLAYQLASNFPSVKSDVSKAIIEKPAVLEPSSSVRDQMEVLFLRPLRGLRQRQQNCPPLSFVIDALDECTSDAELAELIPLLGKALREPDLPKLHILLTSRSEAHIRRAMEEEEVHPLVCEIPVKTSGDGVPDIISLDGADVDNDIYIFFNHSFRNLRDRHRDFPQPTPDQLVKLATRAGRRFIVASTMMKFIDDGHNDPRGRLQIMLDLTSHMLPCTEVYRLYDRILSTCADPNRAYMHLSVVATLADPLPASQISKLLGPGEGNDVETTLVQLRSLMDIPTDSSLPVNIYHSSVRDYVSDPSNCSLPNPRYAPHFLLAYSSLRLMIGEMPASTALLDGLVELKRHSEVIESEDPQDLRWSLDFVVQPLEPLQLLSGLLWVRGHHDPVLQCWLETLDGRAWLETEYGLHWLEDNYMIDGENWLLTEGGHAWLESDGGKKWLQTQAGTISLLNEKGIEPDDINMLWAGSEAGMHWLQTRAGQTWLQKTDVTDWLPDCGWLGTQAGRDWLQTQAGTKWLQTEDAKRDWLLTTYDGGDWLQTQSGGDWLQTQSGGDWMLIEYSEGEWTPIVYESEEEETWLQTPGGRAWLQTQSIQDWLQTSRGRCWLQAQHELDCLLPEGGVGWLKTEGGSEWLEKAVGNEWLQTKAGEDWLQTKAGEDWLQTRPGKTPLNSWSIQHSLNTQDGQGWLQTQAGQDWLKSRAAQHWLNTQNGKSWLQTQAGRDWLQTQAEPDWLDTQAGKDWLLTRAGYGWLKSRAAQYWLKSSAAECWLITQAGRDWLQTVAGEDWLQTRPGKKLLKSRAIRHPLNIGWLQTQAGQYWLNSPAAKYWLMTQDGQSWLQTQAGRDWLQTQAGGNWLDTYTGENWLKTQDGESWLQTQTGRDWLQTQAALNTMAGYNWLQTQDGKSWLQTQAGGNWLDSLIGRDWLKTQAGGNWLDSLIGRDWLKTQAGGNWVQTRVRGHSLQTQTGQNWLQTQAARDWLQTQAGQDWLESWDTRYLLQTQVGQDWLQTQAGRDSLQTQAGHAWLQTDDGEKWLWTESGRDWLQTQSGRDWLQTQGGRDWLQTRGGEEWLQTESGRDWLQTPYGEAWPFMGVWVTIIEFWSALEAVSQFPIVPDLPCLPAFQVIQHLKSLPDFLMFPVFLALRHHNDSTSASPQDHLPDVEIIRAMKAFVNDANRGRERSQSASDALKYACHNWAVHLAQAPRPWDAMLRYLFCSFWDHHLLYWLEMQWCSKGLRACLAILYEGQLLVRECLSKTRESNA